MSYEYGPPVTVGTSPEDEGVPQDNSGAEIIDNEGDTPHTPPANTDTIVEPGGSPSEESGVAPVPEPQSKTADERSEKD